MENREAGTSIRAGLEFLRNSSGTLVEIPRQLHCPTKRIREWRFARLAVLPVTGHHTQLLGYDLGERGVTQPRFLLGKLQNTETSVLTKPS